jgi:hypothetical protein
MRNHRADILLLAERVWGLHVDQARRLKDLEQENKKLRRLVVNLSLDNLVLKETLPQETSEPGAAALCDGPCQ